MILGKSKANCVRRKSKNICFTNVILRYLLHISSIEKICIAFLYILRNTTAFLKRIPKQL